MAEDLRERLAEAAVVVWQQRSDDRITASPTEHCAAMIDALLPLIRDHVAAAVQAERERSAGDRLVMAIFGTPADGPQPFALVNDDPKPKPFAYGVQWPGGTVTVKAIDGSVMGNVTSPSLEDHFDQYGKSAVVWLAEDLGTLADMEERAMRAETELDRLHSWGGLLELLDEHWPADIFPMPEGLDDAKSRTRRDTGPIILGLIRWVDQLNAEVRDLHTLLTHPAAAELLDHHRYLTSGVHGSCSCRGDYGPGTETPDQWIAHLLDMGWQEYKIGGEQ